MSRVDVERDALRHALGGLRDAFERLASHTPLCASVTREEDCDCGYREALVLTAPGVPEGFALAALSTEEAP